MRIILGKPVTIPTPHTKQGPTLYPLINPSVDQVCERPWPELTVIVAIMINHTTHRPPNCERRDAVACLPMIRHDWGMAPKVATVVVEATPKLAASSWKMHAHKLQHCNLCSPETHATNPATVDDRWLDGSQGYPKSVASCEEMGFHQ